MKQIFTYLVVVLLGVLSPSLSGRAQETETQFNGVFKQITPSEELTEGYYIIVNPVTQNTALCGNDMAKKPRGKEKKVTISGGVIKDPAESVVWNIQKDNNGQFTIRNVKSGKFLASSEKDNELLEQDDAQSFTFENYKGQGFTPKISKYYLLFNQNKINLFVFCEEKSRKTFIPHFFKLVEQETIPFTMTAKYATYFGDKTVKLPAGLTAHVGKIDAQKRMLQLMSIGNVVPAGTAVIITGAPGDYALTVSPEAGSAPAENDLKGSMTETTVTGSTEVVYYALTVSPANKICFGLVKTNIPAGKAYLEIPKTAGAAPELLGDFLISSVQQVQRNTESATIYDLNGRKVTQPVSGNLYVRNGKKFIYLR